MTQSARNTMPGAQLQRRWADKEVALGSEEHEAPRGLIKGCDGSIGPLLILKNCLGKYLVTSMVSRTLQKILQNLHSVLEQAKRYAQNNFCSILALVLVVDTFLHFIGFNSTHFWPSRSWH